MTDAYEATWQHMEQESPQELVDGQLHRLHALEGSRTAPRAVVRDIERSLAFQARRIAKMRSAARKRSPLTLNWKSVSNY